MLYLSIPTLGYIRKGKAGLAQSKRRTQLESWIEADLRPGFSGRSVPVTDEIAEGCGWLSAQAKQSGKGLAVIDGLLAATAMHYNLTMVSRNSGDFAVTQVPILNP